MAPLVLLLFPNGTLPARGLFHTSLSIRKQILEKGAQVLGAVSGPKRHSCFSEHPSTIKGARVMREDGPGEKDEKGVGSCLNHALGLTTCCLVCFCSSVGASGYWQSKMSTKVRLQFWKFGWPSSPEETNKIAH